MAEEVRVVYHLIEGRIEAVHYEVRDMIAATGIPLTVQHDPEPVPEAGGPGTTIVLDLLLKAAEGGAATAGGLAVKTALEKIAPVLKGLRHRLIAFVITIRGPKDQEVSYAPTPSDSLDWTEVLDRIPEDFNHLESSGRSHKRYWYPEDESWDSWRGHWGGNSPPDPPTSH